MSVELNHTIIPAKDKWVSAKFLADILNLEAGPEWVTGLAEGQPVIVDVVEGRKGLEATRVRLV